MKLLEIFRFEIAYQLRRGWPWLICAAVSAFTFLFVRVNFVADALYADFFVNSPFLIANTTVFAGLIWLLLAAPVAGEAAARDVATGMHPLTYTLPIRKAEYLGGRFLAAFVLNALILLAVQGGILLAIYAPGVDREMIGPFRAAAYLTAYGYIALPNAFVATAIQFSLSVRSGRAMAAYLGSLLLFFMGFFVASLVLYGKGLGTLLDPVGVRFIIEDLAHAWTTIEQNSRLLALDGTVLRNRLLWLGVALLVLAVTYLRFHLAHRAERIWWRRRGGRSRVEHAPTPAGAAPGTSIAVPDVPRSFGPALLGRQTLAIAWTSFRTIATSWAGLALLLGLPLLTVAVVLDQMVSMGTPLVPTTARVIGELTAPLAAEMSRWLIVPLLIVFFAGELIWRERDAGVAEIVDAAPVSEWVPLLGKFFGLGLVLALFTALQTVAGMVAQTIRGHPHLEVGLYLKILFGLQLPEYLLFAVLALVVHVLVDQKYVGHLVAVVAYLCIPLASMFGIEHNLLVYGAGPAWSYTEMRGFGGSIGPWVWFKAYWAGWAMLLAVVARLLWVRGRESGLRVRLRWARRRLTMPTAWVGGAAVAVILMAGGYVFYNTNVLNEYLSAAEIVERRAEYERRYGRYAEIPQPVMTGTSLRVEIRPERRVAELRGIYRLVNRGAAPIDSIHLSVAPVGVETRAISFDRPATLVLSDAEHGYRIYDLASPLQPGDSMRLGFAVHAGRRGFANRGADPAVAENGSYFTSNAWFPQVGYQRQHELVSASDRRDHGLAPRPVVASLYAAESRIPTSRSGGIAFEAVVGTDAEEIAVAPGALRRSWTEGDRRYFHYSTDRPIGTEWAFLSAEYAVREATWVDRTAPSRRPVVIRIFHHPGHTAHLDGMVRSIQASLSYLSEQFGPYPYGHLHVVEGPGPGVGLHAEAALITHAEGFTTWRTEDDPRALDMPFAVVAHEVAHQWTVPYAFVEGAPFMSEGLAWYSAMQVVKASRGGEQLRRLLAFMRQPYPFQPIRRGEPLLRALDPYLSYRRGPFAMYALSEYVGEERVNRAIRRLIARHDSAGTPPATTLDLYRELQAVTPDSLRYLLHDLFEVNTFWDLETERVRAEQTGGGAWRVTLDVRASKVVADSAGTETERAMDEWVEIGIYGPSKAGEDGPGEPLYLRMHRVRSGEQTIAVTVPRRPRLAGIDPNRLLEWGPEGNLVEVEIESPAGRLDAGVGR